MSNSSVALQLLLLSAIVANFALATTNGPNGVTEEHVEHRPGSFIKKAKTAGLSMMTRDNLRDKGGHLVKRVKDGLHSSKAAIAARKNKQAHSEGALLGHADHKLEAVRLDERLDRPLAPVASLANELPQGRVSAGKTQLDELRDRDSIKLEPLVAPMPALATINQANQVPHQKVDHDNYDDDEYDDDDDDVREYDHAHAYDHGHPHFSPEVVRPLNQPAEYHQAHLPDPQYEDDDDYNDGHHKSPKHAKHGLQHQLQQLQQLRQKHSHEYDEPHIQVKPKLFSSSP